MAVVSGEKMDSRHDELTPIPMSDTPEPLKANTALTTIPGHERQLLRIVHSAESHPLHIGFVRHKRGRPHRLSEVGS